MPCQSYLQTGQADSAKTAVWPGQLAGNFKRACGIWKKKSVAPLFTINFVPKLVSNVLKNFCAIPWHQKPTPLVDCWKIKFVEQDFQSVSNLIFTTYVACKNQFQNWFLLAKNPVCQTWLLQHDFSKIKYRTTGGKKACTRYFFFLQKRYIYRV